MKNLLWFLTAFALFAIPMAASAQFPKPRPAAAPAQAAPAEAAAPAPPPAGTVAPPVVNAQVSLPPATGMDELKSWLNTLFGGLIAALLAKIGFRPSAPVAAGAPAMPAGVATVLTKLNDPSTLAGLEAIGLKVVQTGIPGQLLQSGASLIPGVGPFAAQLEPMLRKIVIDALSAKQGGASA